MYHRIKNIICKNNIYFTSSGGFARGGARIANEWHACRAWRGKSFLWHRKELHVVIYIFKCLDNTYRKT